MGEESQATDGGRNILLFADGTSNSSASPQKTNVWRLYAALDLGPAQAGKREQIAFFDNGVGNSQFTPAALLGIVFGIGVARNVRDIYKFLCRNYHEGDRIFAFGFSRGAYTIRLLIAAVCSLGLAPYESEEQLDLAARDIWRQLRRSFHTNNFIADFIVCAFRALCRVLIRAKRGLLGQPSNYRFMPADTRWWFRDWREHWQKNWWGNEGIRPVEVDHGQIVPGTRPVEVDFVGVWDTVAAYGGPVVEITRAIDEWIWPLTMPNYRLHPRVKLARHALAIDDKRDSFTPLLWDEVHDRQVAERLKADMEKAGEDAGPILRKLAERYNSELGPRIQQVWFAGMHADVGGGYPDDSLAYVSLWWMIEHAEQAGARLIGDVRRQISDYRNNYGPMHDSRSGVGMFYRYQPRYLSAWIDHDPPREFETRYPKRTVQAHVQPATQTFRDPTIARGHYAGRGLLNFPIRLHDSVEQRLSKTTDGYGPNNLPGWYEVDGGLNRIRAPDFKPNEDDVIRQARRNEMLELGSRIKLRRFWYFMSFLAVVLLATRPYWPGWPVLGNFAGTVDDRTDAQLVEATIASFLPGFLGDWLHALFADLFTSLLVVGLIVMTSAMGLGHERAMTDISRNMWDSRFFEKLPNERSNKGLFPPTRWAADFFARSPELQAVLAWIKWRGMPWAIGPFMFAAVFYTAMAGLTQLALVWGESREGTCEIKGKASDALLKGGYFESGWIDIKSKCADLAVLVATDRPYHIAVDMADAQGRMETEKQQPAHWSDGSFDATPEGWVKDSWKDVASKYFRRVVSAPLMAPIAEYRPDKPELERDFSKLWRCTVGVPSYLAWPRLKPGDQPYRWTGSLTTPGTESDAFNARKIGPDWRPTDKEQAQGSLEVARLHVFLNDATLMDYFYANNRGKMRVCLWSEDVPEEDRVCGGVPVQEASEECRPCKPPARAGGKGTKP